MSFNLHFSRDLFLARTNSRLSQQDVAERTGISLREYQNIESGRRCPRVLTFLILIFLFEIDIYAYREEGMRYVPLHLGRR